MQVISSRQTFFAKRVFPALWLGGVAAFLVAAALGSARQGASPVGARISMLLVPVAMLAFGFLLFRKLVWDLADEVQDCGSYLLVRRGGIERRVPLADVMNVSASAFTSPRRVVLRLAARNELGDEVAFIPKMPLFALNPFARNAIAEDLIRRVDAARREGTR